MLGVLKTWIGNRLKEGTTYVGAGMITFGGLGITVQDPNLNTLVTALAHYAPIAGAALVAMSSKHP